MPVQRFTATTNFLTCSADQLGSITECTATLCFQPTTLTWAAPEDLPAGTSPFVKTSLTLPSYLNGYAAVVTGDFNGDGRTDFLLVKNDKYGKKIGTNVGQYDLYNNVCISNIWTTCAHEYVALAQADGTFRFIDLGSIIGFAGQVMTVGDFNGDGLTDFLVTGADQYHRALGGHDYTFLSNGDGTFRSIDLGVPIGATGKVLFSGDFNGDGLTDFYMTAADQYGRAAGGHNWSFLSNGDGTFRSVDLGVQIGTGTVLFSGDFDGDGLTDFYMTATDQSGRATNNGCWSFLSKGDGTFAGVSAVSGASNVAQIGTGKVFFSGDFNGDGLTDFYMTAADDYGRAAGNGVWPYLSNGDGTFHAAGNGPVQLASGQQVIATGDFNGDGRTDFYATGVFMDNTTVLSGATSLFLANADGTFSAAGSDPAIPAGYMTVATGDFTGTGAARPTHRPRLYLYWHGHIKWSAGDHKNTRRSSLYPDGWSASDATCYANR